ncbi:MAG: sulfotransferase domain-containing protein [Myxococcales bacterium]|nr:sulfotransferase domain-containing protein [Myxococcales bacterium]
MIRDAGNRLAKTTDALHEVFADHMVDDGFRRALAFAPAADDVFIACYLKCGTTWTQAIAHGLRTGGDMNFTNLEFVIPFMERAHGLGVPLDAPQVARPRLFKTHLEYGRAPRGARYVVTLRDAADALVSLYNFFGDTFFDPTAISLDAFARDFFCRPNGAYVRYWEHVASWLTAPQGTPRLFLCFEDMVADLPGAVRHVQRYLGLDVDDDTFAHVVHQSSFSFMKAHGDRFATIAYKGEPENMTTVRFDIVRRGRVGDHAAVLSPEIRAELDDLWSTVVAPATGFATYTDLRAALHGRVTAGTGSSAAPKTGAGAE